jgi:histidine ammonia-lyase
MAGNYGLLLEAAAEGVPVYWFNRGSGEQRETVIFEGDALSPANRPIVEKAQLDSFRRGAMAGIGPEVDDEADVRAMMAIRANSMVHTAPTPALSGLLIEFLNKRITPVIRSRGTVGEGDLGPLGNVGGAMIGLGEVYLEGHRMRAKDALTKAGLKPLVPFGADDNALTSSNAYAVARAALAVEDARHLLEWVDVGYTLNLNGMNSSITPLSIGVQRDRPDPWLNWHAAHMLELLRGSYLFESDPGRIIQDPESLRASSVREASAWREWALLRDAVLFQINTADHNPAIARNLGPTDGWELSSPQLMHFYVRGGPLSHGEHGYILSNANWDPYPFATRVESTSIALGNLMVAVMGRIERFRNPFFTGVLETDVLPDFERTDDSIYAPVDLGQEILSLANAVPPAGVALFGTVEDLEAETRLKLDRLRKIIATGLELEACDLLEATLWMDIRAKQTPGRRFGTAPTLAQAAIRKAAPLKPNSSDENLPPQEQVVVFLRGHDAEQVTHTRLAPPPEFH